MAKLITTPVIRDSLQAKAWRAAPQHHDRTHSALGVPHQFDADADALAERQNSTVGSVIARVDDSVKRLPLRVFYRDFDNGKEVLEAAEDHPLQELLDRPNSFVRASEIKSHEVQSLILTGNGIMGLEFDSNTNDRQPTELWPLPTQHTYLVTDKKGMPTGYRYSVDGVNAIPYKLDEVVHSRLYSNQDIFYGRSRIQPIYTQLLGTFYARQYNKAFFKNDATPTGLIFPERPLSEPAKEKFRKSWQKQMGGENRFRIGFADFAGSFQSYSPPLKDMAFIEGLQMDREEIIGMLGGQPVLNAIFQYANYANTVEQRQLFWEFGIMPLLFIVEEAFTDSLAHNYWPDDDLVVKFDLSDVKALKTDDKVQAETDAINVNAGIMTINEIRQDRDLPPVAWGNEPPPKPMLSGSAPPEDKPKDDNKAMDDVVFDGVHFHRKGEDKDRYVTWQRWDQEWQRRSITWARLMGKFFRKQGARVVSNFNDVTQEGRHLAALHMITRADPPDDEVRRLFNPDDENKLLEATIRPTAEQLVRQAGQASMAEAILELGLTSEAVFNAQDPLVRVMLDQMTNRSKLINNTTFQRIKGLISQGLDESWANTRLVKELRQMFSEFSKARATMIARTETRTMLNGARIMGYNQMPEVEVIEWVSTQDKKTRDSHRAIDRTPIRKGGVFPNGLRYPGDPEGPAHEVINCRCLIRAIPKALQDDVELYEG